MEFELGIRPAFISVKNFDVYQHYTDRRPPWIKLYWTLLDDEDFVQLDLPNRGLYCMLILLASRHENRIPLDLNYIKKQLKLDINPDLSKLFHAGFLLASNKSAAITIIKQNGSDFVPLVQSVEKSRKRERKNPPSPPSGETLARFDEFWTAVPAKNGRKLYKPRALEFFSALSPEDQASCIQAAKQYAVYCRDTDRIPKDPHRFIKGRDGELWRDFVTPLRTPTLTVTGGRPCNWHPDHVRCELPVTSRTGERYRCPWHNHLDGLNKPFGTLEEFTAFIKGHRYLKADNVLELWDKANRGLQHAKEAM
jgi:hypothetical protein